MEEEIFNFVGLTRTSQIPFPIYIYILQSLSQRDTMSHNNTNMSQRAQDPKTKNEKTERREGEEGKKKKIGSAIPIQNRGKRDRESESQRNLLAARKRKSSCRGSVTTRSKQSRDFESE